MNKQQRKILLTKIIPKFLIITLIFLGIIAFIGIKILGTKAEREANEFWSNPKNKEKIESAINKPTKPLKTDIKQTISSDRQNNQKFKTINKLKFPIPNGWEIKTDVHETSIDLFNVIFENHNGNGIISIMSRKPHDYIKGLEEYSNYQNEKLVRNMKPTGLILTSDDVIVDKYKGIDAVYEYFDGFHKGTNETVRIVAINMYYKNYAYTLYYTATDEITMAIIGTELL
ncbi:hypothetical protein [Gaetbulibacter jejuensis]|uniref:hypothetical protein n=1 Tax=Gaetbulibacter jejuensis TaxID=584607 RepID=UPI003008F132